MLAHSAMHCTRTAPGADQSEDTKSTTTNHGPPWGVVRVHCSGTTPGPGGSAGTMFGSGVGTMFGSGAGTLREYCVLFAPTVEANIPI